MKDQRVYLAHIMERLERIQRYSSGGKDTFFADALIQDGVIRNFEVIGEAVKRLSPEFRERHPELPWQEMAGFRDVLIHNYDGVDLSRVWAAIGQAKAVHAALKKFLPPLDQLEREINGVD